MKAVKLSGDRAVELVEVVQPEPGPGEVLLEVEACGICGTDLHAPDLETLFTQPVVLGHEFTAAIAAVGDSVQGWSAGDRVVVNPIGLPCGDCAACRASLPNQCLAALSFECSGVGKDGGMAEYVSIDPAHLHQIGDIPAEIAAWTEPLAVAVRGVAQGGVRPDDKVAVFGAGPIGQLVLQVALAARAASVVVVETSEFRREKAAECGATRTISPQELSQEEPDFDVVLDCTGAAPVLDAAIQLAAPGGRIGIVGTYGTPVTLSEPMAAQFKELSIRFSLCYQDAVEFTEAIELLRSGAVDVASLTTEVAGLGEHSRAFAAMRDGGETMKILLAPGMS